MVVRGEGGGEMGEKAEGSNKLQNSHGDVKYSIENIVNNIAITMYGAGWALELSRRSLSKLNKLSNHYAILLKQI